MNKNTNSGRSIIQSLQLGMGALAFMSACLYGLGVFVWKNPGTITVAIMLSGAFSVWSSLFLYGLCRKKMSNLLSIVASCLNVLLIAPSLLFLLLSVIPD